MEPLVARRTWRTLEPYHALVYFAPEAAEEYAVLGLTPPQHYVASRAAAMGLVPAEVAVATFYNFHPDVVAAALPGAWATATPEAIAAARRRGADRALQRVLDDVDDPALAEAAELARRVAEAADPAGRALFAGHAAQPWPEAPHLALWHAVTLLREHRGDGHVAVLVAEGIGPCEALVLHAATGEVPAEVLRGTRGWSEDAWRDAADALGARGWLEPDGTLTEAGATARAALEDRTDRAAAPCYHAIGEEGCRQLRALVRPASRAIVASDAFGMGS